jgi:hypothetical protein
MPVTRESKVPCSAFFSVVPSHRSKSFDGLLHLFECHYDDRIGGFWFGVAELACSFDEFKAATTHPGEPQEIRIHVALDDGRTGDAKFLLAHSVTDRDGRHVMRVKLFGESNLITPGL